MFVACLCRLSLFAASCSSLQCVGFSLQWLLSLQTQASGACASVLAPPGLQSAAGSCGAGVQLRQGTWSLPGPGLGVGSPTFACGFSSTVPPAKCLISVLLKSFPLFTALSSSKHSYYVSRLVGSISSFFLILFHGLNKKWERMYKIPPLPPMFNHYFSV